MSRNVAGRVICRPTAQQSGCQQHQQPQQTCSSCLDTVPFPSHCRAAHLIRKVPQGSLQPLRRVQQLDEGWLVPAVALIAPQFWDLADLVQVVMPCSPDMRDDVHRRLAEELIMLTTSGQM